MAAVALRNGTAGLISLPIWGSPSTEGPRFERWLGAADACCVAMSGPLMSVAIGKVDGTVRVYHLDHLEEGFLECQCPSQPGPVTGA